jgi:hypothetical protein
MLMGVLAMSVLVVASGCGKGNSPTNVVTRFYTLANEGKYTEAKTLLSKEAAAAVDGELGQLVGGFKGICDKNTKNGTITSIDPVSEEIRGEGATVTVTIHYKDGSAKQNDKSGLVRQNGKWLLALE